MPYPLSSKNRFALWCLCALSLYGFGLFYFEFFSDDFGYFLNFARQSASHSGVRDAFASYLTGGVPRLQLGWHVLHQTLFLIFGTHIIGYFLLQLFILVLNSELLFRLLRPRFGEAIAWASGALLLLSPCYRESFYWISANYGFYQVFLILSSICFFERALRTTNQRFKYFQVCASALLLTLSALFIEQGLPLLFGIPVVLYLLDCHPVGKSLTRTPYIIYLVLSASFLIATMLPQWLIIHSSSPTSLADTFRMYYPTPFSSMLHNVGVILTDGIWGLGSLAPGLSKHAPRFNGGKFLFAQFIVSLIMGLTAIFLISRRVVRSAEDDAGLLSRAKIPGLGLWWLGACIVVLPIRYFESRYLYFILCPLAPLFFLAARRIVKSKFPIFLGVCLGLALGLHLDFYYRFYFPLLKFQNDVYAQLFKARGDLKTPVEAIVFEEFPGTYGVAKSGVWINYHATEWWLKWGELSNLTTGASSQITVGNAAFPCRTSGGEPGFQLLYGEYPKERLQTCFNSKRVLFVTNARGVKNIQTPADLLIEFKTAFYKAETSTVALVKDNSVISIPLKFGSDSIQHCDLAISSDVNVTNGIAGMVLYSDRSEHELVMLSSGLETKERIGAKVRIRGKGPYRLAYELRPTLGKPEIATDARAVFSDLHLEGCGYESVGEPFVRTNNPDPQFPYLRWTSLQQNYSLTVPYADAPVWERDFGSGVNDAYQGGDYYCFPDDSLTVTQHSEPSRNFKTYLGMMAWTRRLDVHDKSIVMHLSRRQDDGLVTRRSLDRMEEKEFLSYSKDKPPLNIDVAYTFDVNRPFYKVDYTLQSRSTSPLTAEWTFEDSSVFNFKIGTDAGVETMNFRGEIPNQAFWTGDQSQGPLVYRINLPDRPNMANFEYACPRSSYYVGSFVGEQPRDITDASLRKGVAFAYASDTPHRSHGITFRANIGPGQKTTFTFFKGMLSGWTDLKDLQTQAAKVRAEIDRTFCGK